MKNKLSKLLITLLTILLVIIISSNVQAYTFLDNNGDGYSDGYIVEKDDPSASGASFVPNKMEINNTEHWRFCIHHRKSYKATYDYRYGTGGYIDGAYCTVTDGDKDAPFEEEYTMEYNYVKDIEATAHQDVAYILAVSENKYDATTMNEIWSTALNYGEKEAAGELGKEAAAFKGFYEAIHDSQGNNIFKSTVIDNTQEPQVTLNPDDSYVVGPFNFSYANGSYNGQNKFSWIDNVVAVTDVGEVKVDVLSSAGELITSEIGENGTRNLNGQDFYIMFKNTEATRFKLRLDFGYIESCYAHMQLFEGKQIVWKWKKVTWTDTKSYTYNGNTFAAHDHGIETVTVGYEHEDGDDDCFYTAWRTCGGEVKLAYTGFLKWEYKCKDCSKRYASKPDDGECTKSISYRVQYEECPHAITEERQITGTSYLYELYKEEGVETQKILHVLISSLYNEKTGQNESKYAHMRYGKESITGEKEIKLTTELSGRVFIDQDMGKVNEGNNTYDSGEGLGNIEVRLFDASNGEQVAITITDNDANKGYYKFENLRRFKTYYVRFSYNGMLYTNVINGTAPNSSKATENSQNNDNNRANFNSKFSEIGSYPANYQTIDCITGEKTSNKTYLQENIVNLFIEIADEIVKNNGNKVVAYQNIINKYNGKDSEIKNKVQFIADSTINAYTVQTYQPRENIENVNLGIKARPTFDMALYKDVLKAQVSINGKNETYNYDSRKGSANGFSVGIREQDYLTGLRSSYIGKTEFTNQKQTRAIETDTYDLNIRQEDITNGQGKYNLTDAEKLKIYVTYKISLRNQSSIAGTVTEIVDYYDKNYTFVEAYVGDSNGNKTDEKGNAFGEVTKYDTSMYGNEYKSTKNSYNTMYLRTKTQTKLSSELPEQYIYVVLELNNASTLLSKELLENESTLNALNLAEINGYKTDDGLIDIDSNPGNLNISNIEALTQDNIINYQNIKSMYEDDTSRAPVVIYKLYDSRTLEGTVFEDSSKNGTRGKLDNNETKIAGVKVELIEIKNNQNIPRMATTTDANGAYKFTGFLPGDYIVRYTYGADDKTAMTKDSIYPGLNAKSYNGQDYQSTKYKVKKEIEKDSKKIDYWYTTQNALSDATDNINRVNEVIKYSTTENGTAIVNHKAEVFNSYKNPQASHITKEVNRELANELATKTYRYADTSKFVAEIEYATQATTGTKVHEYKITGVDFGIVERPKAELTIDQDVKHIKVTAADGVTILFDTETETNNLQWVNKGNVDKYDTNELINIIMDDELISGAKLEITYNITVTNNSEQDGNTTTIAKNILNYVSNNLNFNVENNKDANGNALWEVVSKDYVQTNNVKTYVNSTIDLSTQAVILKATNSNPLVTTNLKPKDQVTTTLKLEKVLSAESGTDDLSYTNLAEIVEIDNTVGRYDHGATPGNQQIDKLPQEHDSTGVNNDAKVIVTPPTGSIYIYYLIGITSSIMLAAGIYFIRKYVVKKK